MTFFQDKEKEMLLLLEQLVNIDSGTSNKQGVDEVGAILQKKYEELDFTVDVRKELHHGNILIVKHKEAVNPEIIIIAHMDTVFKKGTASKRPFTIKGDRAYGPGVIDMKASHVTLLYAIKSLITENKSSFKNVQIILNSDEEIGTVISRKLIEEQAKGKKFALIMEPARKDGSLVSARRGGGRYTLHVKGKAAHSGLEPQNGLSAIEELAHKIVKLHQLNDYANGINVNVGIIEGGEAVNTVAPSALAHVDARISRMDQIEYIDQKVREICSTADVKGTTITIEGGITRPPMVKNEQTIELLEIVKEVGIELGINITDVATGGGSDASFTSALGVPTLDGFGPIGGYPHSVDEYLEITSLTERSLLLAKVIDRLSE